MIIGKTYQTPSKEKNKNETLQFKNHGRYHHVSNSSDFYFHKLWR